MVPLGDEAQEEAHFGSFVDIANLDARLVHGLCRTYHRLKNHFGPPYGTQCDADQVEARFGPFGDSVNVDTR